MAENKQDLINRGKELGLNLKRSMSVYELKHRIKEAEEEAKNPKPKPAESKNRARGGEY